MASCFLLVLLGAGTLAAHPHPGSGVTSSSDEQRAAQLITCVNASDCTDELQAALDGCMAEILLRKLPDGRNWITRPLFVRSCEHSQRMVLKPTVVLEAIKGGFHGGGDTLIDVSNVTGFSLHGPGATLRMHRSDYSNRSKYSHSEGRMAIALRGVTNAVISGAPGSPLTVQESGGDGCYIAHLHGSQPAQNSRNVSIHHVIFTKNFRQGISVIGVVGLTVTNTALSFTAGTPPAAGACAALSAACTGLSHSATHATDLHVPLFLQELTLSRTSSQTSCLTLSLPM